MTFAVRCLGVSLTFFLISYCALSMAVGRAWRLAWRAAQKASPRYLADVLFMLRGFPVAAAVVVTLAFVVPSFLLLEPQTSAEPVGEIPLTLGGCCLFLFAVGTYSAVTAYLKTLRSVRDWLEDATALPTRSSIAVFRIRPRVPALTLAGLRAPRVLLSEAAAALLGPRELEIALQHEIAHARRRDNWKKLFFRFWIFPGMLALEEAWNGAEEMAADDEAVSCTSDALDLASALIKLSRLAPVHPAALLTSALVQPSTASVNARVERLIRWDDRRVDQPGQPGPWYFRSALLGSALGVLLSYGAVLHRMHALTEWLVR
jgi:Zn-dependent protease with chaperone function